MSLQKPTISSKPVIAPGHPNQQPNTPGFCALRLENLEHQTSTTKRELMASIAADICATFISIAKYSEEGILQAQHTDVIDKVIQTIRDTDVKQRHLLRRRARPPREKKKRGIRKKYSRLAGQADGLSRAYQTKMRKLSISLHEAREEVARLQRERDMLLTCLKKDVIEEAASNDNADGEFEVVADAEDVDGEFEIE